MAACLWKTYSNIGLSNKINLNIINNVRHGHHIRGKPPGIARTLKQRLEELNFKDPAVHFRVDIGFPAPSISKAKEIFKRLDHVKKNRKNNNLEKLSRDKNLIIDLEDVKSEWLSTAGPYQIKKIADHYGVYEHLFGEAYFHPRVPLCVNFTKNDNLIPVYYGNVIKPLDATEAPTVTFTSNEKSMWTLLLTNPDGHLTQKSSEYIHWMVANIPGKDISKGETIVPYLQPFPPRGTGFHRYIFVLYKQDKPLNFLSLKIATTTSLTDRTFNTYNFYRERQDNMTPAGLAFFQSDWDASLTDFYHHKLNMLEPVFEYDFPPPYIRPQTWFPLKQPFNLYMDKYQDPKKIAERYFKMKLKEVHPFKKSARKLPFPNAEPIPENVPSWLKLEITKNRLGWGRINDV